MTIPPYDTNKSLLEAIEALQETIKILQDKELMAEFHEGVKELAESKGESLDEVLKELG